MRKVRQEQGSMRRNCLAVTFGPRSCRGAASPKRGEPWFGPCQQPFHSGEPTFGPHTNRARLTLSRENSAGASGASMLVHLDLRCKYTHVVCQHLAMQSPRRKPTR